jgi:hypothetical protein
MDVMAKLVRIMWVPVLLVALYAGFVFWQRNPEWPFGRRALAHTQSDPMAAYGNTVKILNFYGPREVLPGGQAEICYGVVNATAVRLDPPVERLWPALSRCFEVKPAESIRYTLTAEGKNDARVSNSIEITVKR